MWKRLRSRTNEGLEPDAIPAQRQQNKLTKPRTIKHTPTAPSRLSEKRASKQQILEYNESQETLSTAPTNDLNKNELRRQAHSQIFGTRDTTVLREQLSEEGDGFEDAVTEESEDPTGPRLKGWRSSSSLSQLPAPPESASRLTGSVSTSQLSLASSQDGDHSFRLSGLQRASKAASQDGSTALRMILLALPLLSKLMQFQA